MSNVVVIAGNAYEILSDSALPKGRRGWVRSLRPATGEDPGVPKRARWKLSGPIGVSRERPDGFLGHDYSDNIDTLYDNLITSVAARNAVTLSGSDPLGAGTSAALGGFALGSAPLGGGTGAIQAGDLTHADEDRGYLFFHRGPYSTQVDPSDFSVIETVRHDAIVRGAAVWRNRGYLGLGGTVAMQRRTAVTASGSSYEDVQVGGSDVLTKEMTVGTDRLWMVRADSSGANENELRYSLDALASVSNSFVVGDPGVSATGIGTYGPVAVAGSEVGAFSFSALGKPVKVLSTLKGHRSTNNGRQMADLWGWFYIITDTGIEATVPGTGIQNPAGPGADRDFEGEPFGRPTAVWAYKDSLWCAFLTPSGHTYVMRGLFDDGRYGGNTAGTGKPAWFPFRRLASTESFLIFSTSLRTNPTLIVGEGTNLSYYTLGRGERDISDSNYVFGTDGGTWYGSTLMRDPHMHKSLRYFELVTENCTVADFWEVAVSIDGGDYIEVGTALKRDGHHVVRPVVGGQPDPNVHGHSFKPRLTQTAGGSSATSSPPQIRGFLDMVYDERPDTVEEHVFVVRLGARKSQKAELDGLYAAFGLHPEPAFGSQVASPVSVKVPDENRERWGFVTAVQEERDVQGDNVKAVQVRVVMWETGEDA